MGNNAQVVKVVKERDYRPHAQSLHGAEVLLSMAAALPSGCYYLWMGALLYSVFAFEGYLNYIGKIFFADWIQLERSLHWKKKIKKLADHFDVSVNERIDPLLTVYNLYDFRDRSVHPKPIVFSEKSESELGQLENVLNYENSKSDEELFCTEENAVRCLKQVKDMMTLLYDGGKLKYESMHPYRKDSYVLHAPFFRGGQSGSLSLTNQ